MARARDHAIPSAGTRRASIAMVALALLGVSLVGTAGSVGADTASDTVVFSADGTYTVPDGVTSLSFTVTGAGGGSSSPGWITGETGQTPGPDPDATMTPGGSGGVERGLLAVTPGEVLTVVVGKAAGHGSSSANGPDEGGTGGTGYGSGGTGGAATGGLPSGGGGGGASAILSGATPLVVAGGGGGAGSPIAHVFGTFQPTFGGCPSQAPPAPAPGPSTTSASLTPCLIHQQPTLTIVWLPGCPGLSSGSTPTQGCPLGPVPIASHDGAGGIDAQSDVHQGNGAGGGGGGGFTGGAGGVPAVDASTSGGGQAGANFTHRDRTSAVTESTADNAGGTGEVTLTPVTSPGPSIPSTSPTSTVAAGPMNTRAPRAATPVVAQPTYAG